MYVHTSNIYFHKTNSFVCMREKDLFYIVCDKIEIFHIIFTYEMKNGDKYF